MSSCPQPAPGPVEGSRARPRLFAVLCLGLVALLWLEHVGRMGRIGFATHDDMAMDLAAQAFRSHGLAYGFGQASAVARNQGRVAYYFSYFLGMAPYLVDSDVARGVLIAGVHFLSLAAACGFLAFYAGPSCALLALAALYAMLPHWWRAFPVAGYPTMFHPALLLFFAGAAVQVAAIRWELPRGAGRAARAASLVLIFLSLAVYEAADALFALVAAAALAFEARRSPPDSAQRRRVRTAAVSMLAVFVLYGLLYIAYRWMHPPVYGGVRISAASVFNPVAVARAMAAYTASGLPLAQFYLQRDIISRFSADSLAQAGLWRFWLHGLTMGSIAEAGLFAAAAVCFLRLPPRTSALRALGTGAVAAAGGLIATLPLAVTIRYQQNPLTRAPHVPGYLAFVGLAVAAVCALAAASALLPRFGRALSAWAIVAAGGAAFLLSAATGVANEGVVRSQESHYATWKLVNLFLRSDRFAALPENAVIVAPTLWDEIDPSWPFYGDYWQNYVAAHSGRGIRVERQFPQPCAAARPEFYLEIQRPAGLAPPVLLFHDVARRTGAALAGPRVSRSSAVISEYDLKEAVLRYLRVPEGRGGFTPGLVDGMLETLPLPPCLYNRGAYATRVPSPGLVAGTATVESARIAGAVKQAALDASPLALAFEKGFMKEEAGTPYRRRAAGDGEAVLAILNQTGAPVPLTLKLVLRTYRTGRVPFDFTLAGRRRSIQAADRDPFAAAVTALPGRTEVRIRCHGAPLPGADRLVFGVESWELADATGEAAPAVEFGAGFSVLEDWNGLPFRWNDSASGAAALFLVNSGPRAVRARFQAELFTGHPAASRFELRIAGRQETLQLSGDPLLLSREVHLPPGRTEVMLHSWARPLEGAAPRQIRFGIRNWRVDLLP